MEILNYTVQEWKFGLSPCNLLSKLKWFSCFFNQKGHHTALTTYKQPAQKNQRQKCTLHNHPMKLYNHDGAVLSIQRKTQIKQNNKEKHSP